MSIETLREKYESKLRERWTPEGKRKSHLLGLPPYDSPIKCMGCGVDISEEPFAWMVAHIERCLQ